MSGTTTPPPPELTAVCYLLTMDTGLFCVSLAEPPQPSFANPHFPGVRLSLPPGPESEHRGVTICTFRADGWLDMDRPAALVHVHRGPARILMTIYHEASQPREAAPQLAITQLAQTVPPAARSPAHAPLPAAAPQSISAIVAPPSMQGAVAPPAVLPSFAAAPQTLHASGQSPVQGMETLSAAPLTDAQIVSHIRNRGDVRARLTEWIGLPGSRLWIEGFGISVPNGWAADDIEYQAVVARTGVTSWMSGPEFCGSRGQTMPLLGFGVRLKGAAGRLYDCSYRASFIDGTTAGPVQQGLLCQSVSLAALEAFQITVSRR
jgi:hypothetical protein